MGETANNKPLRTRIDWCKGCGLCSDFCPRGVLAINLSKVEILYPENCIGCGVCERICPDFAIYLGGEEDE